MDDTTTPSGNPECYRCGTELGDHHWYAFDRIACLACHDQIARDHTKELADGRSWGRYGVALLRGSVVAILCALLGATLTSALRELHLWLLVAMGAAIGASVGYNRAGYARYRIGAAVLAYLSLAMVYYPSLQRGFERDTNLAWSPHESAMQALKLAVLAPVAIVLDGDFDTGYSFFIALAATIGVVGAAPKNPRLRGPCTTARAHDLPAANVG